MATAIANRYARALADLVLQPGDNVITVTARDGLGREGTATITVQLGPPSDPGQPWLSVP